MDFLPGVLAGVVLTVVVVFLTSRSAFTLKKKCQHDRIYVHSTERYRNTSYLNAICLDCGKAVKLDLGFVANSEGAHQKASSAVLVARGYNNPGADNTFIRDR